MSEDLKQAALDYHRYPRPGKLEIKATKPLANQRDLALAYSPGVAAACREIEWVRERTGRNTNADSARRAAVDLLYSLATTIRIPCEPTDFQLGKSRAKEPIGVLFYGRMPTEPLAQ